MDVDRSKDKNKKRKKKKKRKNAFVKDLGIVDEEYEGHKDPKNQRKERQETIIEFKQDNEIKSNGTLMNSENKNKEGSDKSENAKSKNKEISSPTKNKKDSKVKTNKMERIKQDEENNKKSKNGFIIEELSEKEEEIEED